jgi:hypothetical protein
MYLNDNGKTNQLDAFLNSYTLFSTIDFPTRIYNDSSSAIDDIFNDITSLNNHQVLSLINGLSYHNAQIIILHVLQNKPHELNLILEEILKNIPLQNSRIVQVMKLWILFLSVMMLIQSLTPF